MKVLGTGKDDGRDATYDGPSGPTSPERPVGHDHWDGYHVFQAKHHERPLNTQASKTWLLAQVRRELAKWSDTVTRNGKVELKRKGQRPDYYVVITNVALSGQIGGGIDEVERLIRDHAKDPANQWPIRDCAVWDRSKVERLLDAYADVRMTFNGLLTVGDVLAALAGGTMTDPTVALADAVPLLEEHARAELLHRGKLALGEAGHLANDRIDLAGVAIDLPAHGESESDPISRIRVLRHLITRGNRNQRPSVTGGASPHVLLMGGPGQGKTTLGRILVQTYRSALLQDRPALSEDVRRVVGASLTRATEIGLPSTTVRRWPFRVDLSEYATAAGPDTPLVEYIAMKINAATGAAFTAKNTRDWLAAWPWLLVLDGYDEVAAAHARDLVAQAVTNLLQTAATLDADLVLVVTTRPQGYANELPPSLQQIHLANLSAKDAVAYATRLTNVRMGTDPSKGEVIERITAAVDNEVTSRLMRTPLQVMILSLLLEKRRKPPQDRAALFAAYYDVIYDREVEKKNFLSDVLASHRLDIDAIHRTVALTLQKRAETDFESESLMPAEELHQVIRQRLVDQEHFGPELDRLVTNLTRAARDRLVLLAANGKNQVGFDLRSLQEYMAAQALTFGPDPNALTNLNAIAHSAHWRNTWLLAVGTLYRDQPHLFDGVLQGMRDIDADDTLSVLAPTGPRLATAILEDGVAANNPKHVRLLVAHALEALHGVNLGASRLGEVLADQPDLNAATRTLIVRALQSASTGQPENQQAARLVLAELRGKNQVGELAAQARQLWSSSGAARLVPPSKAGRPVTLADALPDATRTWPKSSPARTFRDHLRRVKTTTDESGVFAIPEGLSVPASALEVVANPDQLLEVVTAIDAINPTNWTARATITALLWRARERRPVADTLDFALPQ
ncbi:hypothetical protein M3148_16420 [Georgenia satyanarayanai]|uniref:NACHT domain-containing protein n=1 Tax=Georgenia satyanarayanai TaxID=860221 RepID=UPI0020411C38|nr:hypothetical protein [Georgenia satyanarayanai]MCM3662562.1 hypothetical protein [Georgenia satyanarayanai]